MSRSPQVAALSVLTALALTVSTARAAAASAPSVLQYHKQASRAGLYVDPLLTAAGVAGLHRDAAFDGRYTGAVYAQPLFMENGPGGRDTVFVATEQNEVIAINAATGATIWKRRLATPMPLGSLPCGNIDPLGITGTPVIDADARTLYVAAMTTADGGMTARHRIFALGIDDGAVKSGWPVDAQGLQAGGFHFDSPVENQRGALLLLAGNLYVPYGGHYGDCGDYHGWVVQVPLTHPSAPTAWASRAQGAGTWSPGGLASDGTSVFVATGNSFGVTTWADGEAIIRLGAGPVFSGASSDYFAPADWVTLDDQDLDIGGSGPLLVHVPHSTPSDLVVALGKNGRAYLMDQAAMGGVGHELASAHVGSGPIINGATTYTTAQGTYVVFKGRGLGCPNGTSGDLTAVRIRPGTAHAAPGLAVAWCASQNGRGSPIVTSTSTEVSLGTAIVWSVGAESDNRLHGFDGDTGVVAFNGGGTADGMSQVRRFQTPIVAKGRFYVAGDDRLYAFAVNAH